LDSDSTFISLRRWLAFLLAKAGCEVFPDAQVVAIQGTDRVFYADFCFSQPFEEAFLPLIEERLRLLVKENPAINTLETVAASARGLLERAGQRLQAAQLPAHPQMLVEVGVLDKFALLQADSEACETPGRFFWELIGIVDGGDVEGEPVVRLMGIACEDLSSLKASKKFWTRNPYIPPSELAVQGGFLTPLEDAWIWLPRGEAMRQDLRKKWEGLLEESGFRLVSTGGNFPFEQGLEEIADSSEGGELRFAEAAYAHQENEDFHCEGLLTPARGWTDRLVRICPKERVREVCISSLQFILQIPRILSFEAQLVLCSSLSGDAKDLRGAADAVGIDYLCETRADRSCSSLEVRIRDRLGRWWTGPSLWVAKGQPLPGHRAVFASCFGKWERLIGLLIEKDMMERELTNKLGKRTGSTL
jgi:threonyl-tRNA synthetase